MRVLVVGDPHARASALRDFERLTEAVCGLLAREPVDLVVVTGDLLHEHAYVHTAALNAALDFLRRVAAFPRRLYALMGNHDLASNQVFLEPRHAFNALKGDERIRIVDEVVIDEGFCFVPYVPPGRFREALATTGEAWRTARAIFAHQEFRGARDGTHVSQVGDSWTKDLPLVVSGHYHTYQWVKVNLCYVGSPAAHDFGAEGAHGVSLFTFDETGGFREERLSLGLPERVTIEVPLADVETFVPPAGDDLVRLVVTGSPHELIAFRKSAVYRKVSASVQKLVLRSSSVTPPAGVARGSGTYLERLRALAAAEADPLVAALLDSVLAPDAPPARRPEPEAVPCASL